MQTVTSRDGTTIAFDRIGEGPPVILVDGALSSRTGGLNAALAACLAPGFCSITYDRRGRGDSGDTAPYAVEREIEDLEALIDEVGGSVFLYGISSGAALALEAACRLPGKVRKLALYEAPFVVDDSRQPVPDDYRATLDALVASDRRGDAVKLFMGKGVGLPGIVVALLRFLPAWSAMKSLAHTLPYDAAIMGDTQAGKPLSAARWSTLSAPTLVVGGGKSPAWMRHGVQALADALPTARQRTLDGQTHIVKAGALAPVLADFFSAQA